MYSTQIDFFEQLKTKILDNHSLVYELVDLLDISMDSSYRRLRGETPLTFGELQILCKHYNISFDSFCNIHSENVIFQYKSLVDASSDIFSCFEKIFVDMNLISKCEKANIVYAANDIPSFHLFKYPELTGFRLHNWLYNMLKVDKNNENLSYDIFYKEHFDNQDTRDKLSNIVTIYENIPSVEIWTDDTIMGMLKAIDFYFDSYLFNDKKELLTLCECILNILDELFNKPLRGNLDLYISDIQIENNYIYIQADDLKFVYLKLYSLNNIMTTNKSFCRETEIWLNNLISKSTLVSGSSEKIRKIFYMKNVKRVESVMQRIKNS